jgi:hypothetical protein
MTEINSLIERAKNRDLALHSHIYRPIAEVRWHPASHEDGLACKERAGKGIDCYLIV